MRITLSIVVLISACAGPPEGRPPLPSGVGETVFTAGEDPDNPFFAALGTNARSCATCHDQDAGWSVTPEALQARFDDSDGLDPVFRALDGATSPDADVSTVAARRDAYALLLAKGLVRVGLPVPDDADFTLTAVDDPYGFATAAELSLFRRPLPATNLRFASQLMWDGRAPSLELQAIDALVGHAEADAIDDDAVARLVAFESSIYTAQARDDLAGDLADDGARGGADALAELARDGAGFALYAAWLDDDDPQRAAIARGEQIFDRRPIRIRGVAGLADQDGTCATCHDEADVGSHATPRLMDLGIADDDRRTAELPLYTFTRASDGRVSRRTDPGAALITGRWADLGKFKVPSLRGLAMRPPYFHDGRAADLGEVLRFYQQRFDLDLSRRERADLIAFLSAL